MYQERLVYITLILLFAGTLPAGAHERINLATKAAVFASDSSKPLNILLFTADDLDRNSLGCYGGTVPDISPNIDRFAQTALKFDRAFVNSAICQPSRGIIATGLYEHNSGVNGFFKMNDSSTIPIIMEIVRAHGYATGILGKLGHSTPKRSFKWDYAFDQQELGDGRSPSIYYARAAAFLKQCKESGKPFYFMVNSHDPHRPYCDPSQPLKDGQELPSRIYKPGEITVPGFVPDLPLVRKELSFYYNSTRRLDDTFGKVLQALEESGLADNTLVVFLSDNGIAIPFAKANAYYASNRTPLLVRYPGVTKAGRVDGEDFVASIDFLPTFLEALGIPNPSKVDGRSFLPLLKGGKQSDRDRFYGQIDYKAGGGPTPIRSVATKKYLYIYNAWSDGQRIYRNNNEGLTYKAIQEAAATDSFARSRVQTWEIREPEELYDLEKDPDCLHNLVAANGAASGSFVGKGTASVLTQYRADLLRWMTRTHDPLLDNYKHRQDAALALSDYYKIYPEAEGLDKNKKTYSKGKGKGED